MALAALDRYCRAKYHGKTFAELSDDDKDEVLKGLESGKIKLDGVDGKAFFTAGCSRTCKRASSPTRSTAATATWSRWKMIGFPGARYNYLDWIDRHNERYPLPPVSITGRADWTPKALVTWPASSRTKTSSSSGSAGPARSWRTN